MRLINLTVRQKLSFTYGIILFLLLIFSAIIFVFSFRLVLLSEVKKDLQTLSVETLRNHTVIDNSNIALTNDKSGISPREEFLESNTSALFLDANYKLIAGFGLFEFYDSSDKVNLETLVTLAKKSFSTHQFTEGQFRWRDKNVDVLATPIKSGEKVMGILLLSKDISPLEQIFNSITLILIIISVGAFFGSILLGNFLVKQMFMPLIRLTKSIEKVDLDKLDDSIHFPGSKSDELVILVDRFNEMLKRLKESSSQQKEFVENVSHELKTPLTKAISSLEIAGLEHLEANNDLEIIRGNLFGLNSLIENILFLTSLKKTNLGPVNPIFIKPVLEQILSEFKGEIKANGLGLNIRFEDRSRIYLPAEYLTVVLRNILGNAIKYSPPWGKIEIIGRKNHQSFVLSIINSAESRVSGENRKIFQRFYRGSNSGKIGYGIGLAIVKRICELYEIKYLAQTLPNNHLEVTLEFALSRD